MCLLVMGRGVTHHLSGLERISIKVCEAEAVFWEPVTILQLLRITRGLVLVRVSVLDKKKDTGLGYTCFAFINI